ncbi:MAG TPA: hypothetical protein VE685_11030 [Thermoanaerobaculia bacterium]|nr:hypothetical protein [Thermoanaerobaculia bacterium]
MKKMSKTGDPTGRIGTRRRGAAGAVAALVLAGGGLAAGLAGEAQTPSPKPPKETSRPVATAELAEREARSLELALERIRRMDSRVPFIGAQPIGAGALAAAALAAQGGPAAGALREDAARLTGKLLDVCADRWGRNEECGRAQIPLQRLVLQFPQTLPADLLARLRAEVSTAAPPPGPPEIQDPWSFQDTENQRMIRMARSVVAHAVAGTAGSPAARAWGEYAAAFLAAHDREGWYEAESPGYMALSINALLHLADHAPQEVVRERAARQLDVLFAAWAQEQVGGYPAGAKSRTSSPWALADGSTPWPAWAWILAGLGDPETINFMERPELAVAAYQVPAPVVRLLAERRRQPPYEIRERRHVGTGKRREVSTALYSYATPDYILGAVQSVADMDLRVSGGQEIVATLYAEGDGFAPLYLWSRTSKEKGKRWKEWSGRDKAVAHRNLMLARLGEGNDLGHAYLSPPWSRPEGTGDVLVTRRGDTFVALVTEGGWEVAPAVERFPAYYAPNKLTAKRLAGAWVAVPKRQPALIALEAGRRSEHGDFEAWKRRVTAKARLRLNEGELRFAASDGTPLTFLPGRKAAVAGKALEPELYPPLDGPFLASREPGRWTFDFGDFRFRLEPLAPRPAMRAQPGGPTR